ncbi:hypothetical protein PVK06_041759 [Gossypium arboreum]|uniref:Retrotransposon Copia-like N-terminal domain-containing protein n=1 Tax=Gossypium arboreum TaxID=29729 RepID=A0ABR0NBB3_GOSAR|nr:hypothetical protein PVK06_041759 [Gossypium arboreum]
MVTPSGSTVDFNHPLHLHPSDNPGAQLVSHQLLGFENYTIWSQSNVNSIVGEEKIGFGGWYLSQRLGDNRFASTMGPIQCYSVILDFKHCQQGTFSRNSLCF